MAVVQFQLFKSGILWVISICINACADKLSKNTDLVSHSENVFFLLGT